MDAIESAIADSCGKAWTAPGPRFGASETNLTMVATPQPSRLLRALRIVLYADEKARPELFAARDHDGLHRLCEGSRRAR